MSWLFTARQTLSLLLIVSLCLLVRFITVIQGCVACVSVDLTCAVFVIDFQALEQAGYVKSVIVSRISLSPSSVQKYNRWKVRLERCL